MASIRITGTTLPNMHKRELLGTAFIDPFGHIQRTLDLPETAYRRIEDGMAKGAIEGTLVLADGRRLDWFLDRAMLSAGPARGTGFTGCGEGI